MRSYAAGLLTGLGLAALELAVLAGAAAAQTVPTDPPAASQPPRADRPALRDKFAAANTSHDGRLTLGQAQAGGLRLVARNFGAIDATHQGFVTWPEVQDFLRTRRAARQHGAAAAVPEQ